jgi:YidC/Oxa1 family membrane protein insertase
MTDKYWLAALIPEQSEMIKGRFQVSPGQRRRRL